jgi:hypothetical protein
VVTKLKIAQRGQKLHLIDYVSVVLFALLVFSSGLTFVSAFGIGVQTGYWIKYTGSQSGQQVSTIKLTILNISENVITANLTYEYPNGSQPPLSQLVLGNVTQGDTSPYVIPANLMKGDQIPYFLGGLTIEGEAVRSYAGASRAVVYASRFSYTYYWDKQTGMLLEQGYSSGSQTSPIIAVETNIWNPSIFDTSNPFFWIMIIAIAIIVVAAALLIVKFLVLGKKKPATAPASPPSTTPSNTTTIRTETI